MSKINYKKTGRKLFLVEKVNMSVAYLGDDPNHIPWSAIVGITDDEELARSHQDVYTKVTEIPWIEREHVVNQTLLQKTIDEIVTWYTVESHTQIKECTAEDFASSQHFSTGMRIRNEYKLWQKSELYSVIKSVDPELEHPDDQSHYILTLVWEKIKNL